MEQDIFSFAFLSQDCFSLFCIYFFLIKKKNPAISAFLTFILVPLFQLFLLQRRLLTFISIPSSLQSFFSVSLEFFSAMGTVTLSFKIFRDSVLVRV